MRSQKLSREILPLLVTEFLDDLPNRVEATQIVYARILRQLTDWIMEHLVLAAITLWNTVYMHKAIQRLAEQSAPFPEDCLPHLSPLIWDHILFTGDYQWQLTG